jgi:hypothetical protein
MLAWTDIDIRGKKASFCDAGGKRLYVSERFGQIEAWIGSELVDHFECIADAKAEASRRAAGHPPMPPKPRAEYRPRSYPKPNPVKFVAKPAAKRAHKAKVVEAPVEARVEPVLPTMVPEGYTDITPPRADIERVTGHCRNCAAKLGRSGKCPALCEPVPEEEVRPYDGPRFVGKTHTAKLGAPVSW